jgi:hypothetical protein
MDVGGDVHRLDAGTRLTLAEVVVVPHLAPAHRVAPEEPPAGVAQRWHPMPKTVPSQRIWG